MRVASGNSSNDNRTAKIIQMKQKISQLLAQKGYEPVFDAIRKSAKDLKQAQYNRVEIKETLLECFGVDEKLVSFINEL